MSHLRNTSAERSRKLSMQGDGRGTLLRMNTPDIYGQSIPPVPLTSHYDSLKRDVNSSRSDLDKVNTESSRSRCHSHAANSTHYEVDSFVTSEHAVSEVSYPPLTENNLAIVRQDSQCSRHGKYISTPSTNWKWTWGDLPIKFSDPSIADLHSLTTNVALLKKKHVSTGDTPKNEESGIITIVSQDIGLDLSVSEGTLHNTNGCMAENKSNLVSPSVTESAQWISDDTQLANESSKSINELMIESNVCEYLEARSNSMVTTSVERVCDMGLPPLRRNTSTATAVEVAAALTAGASNRILSLCAHILSGEPNAPEGLPTSPTDLKRLLLRYAVSEEQFEKSPVEVVTNPNLVVVVNDLLIPWRLVHAHLTSLLSPEGDDDSCVSGGGTNDMLNDSSNHCGDTNKEFAVTWAGTNLNSWGLDSVAPTISNSLVKSDKDNNVDDDDYGLIESFSDRSSTLDNRTSIMSKEGDTPFIDDSGELLYGAYACYFKSSANEGEINMWSKDSVNWNSSTDLTKMRFHMFKSFTLGHDEHVPDLLRPYVDASIDKDSCMRSNASEVIDDSEDSVVLTSTDESCIAGLVSGDRHKDKFGNTKSRLSKGLNPMPSLQASRSHESGLDSLMSSLSELDMSKSLNILENHEQDTFVAASEVEGRDTAPIGPCDVATVGNIAKSILEVENYAEGKVSIDVQVDTLEDISPEDIRPGPARGDITNTDESDTESFYSLNVDDIESCSSVNQDSVERRSSLDVDVKESDDLRDLPRSRKYLYRKSLVPSQGQLKAMNLVNGQNEITFIVEGEDPVQAHVYVWPPDAKIIVADIEGAVFVTSGGKSLGKLAMSLWGGSSSAQKDTHEGLAQLFNNIASNGYHFLYIATTPNASSKDDLLKSQHTDGPSLPLGPVFLPPDALIQTFGRERTDLYKAAALRGVRTLFSKGHHNPYHAAFGAHEKDVRAFDRCGLPLGRTFLVNEKGEITTVTSAAVKRSFAHMNAMLHEVFPTINDLFSRSQHSSVSKSSTAVEDAYGDFNFWRVPPKLLHL